jgi:hypothetical protein
MTHLFLHCVENLIILIRGPFDRLYARSDAESLRPKRDKLVAHARPIRLLRQIRLPQVELTSAGKCCPPIVCSDPDESVLPK